MSSAEKEPTTYHSPGVFDKKTGEIKNTECTEKLSPKFQNVFGKTIIELAEQNKRIVGITPAMASGSSLNMMMQVMPERAFDVGIAEQHAVTFAAGLAAQGMIPFCNIYSTFMQRAYDQVIHDVALQKLHVVFCIDRGGVVGEDGDTHHGAFDMAYLRTVPNITIAAPLNEAELRDMMYTSQLDDVGTFSIRYPRGRGFLSEWKTPFKKMEIGKGQKLKDGTDIAILTIGIVGNFAMEAANLLEKDGIKAAVYNMRFLKPIDGEILHQVFQNFKKVITVEDGAIIGGMGSAVLEFMADNGYSAQVKRLGIPDQFAGQGSPEELYRVLGYDAEGIIKAVKALLNS